MNRVLVIVCALLVFAMIGSAENQQSWFSGSSLLIRRPAAAQGAAPLGITNLVAHWLMNDNAASTTVLDNKGFTNGIAARNTSAVSTNGKILTAIYFDGTADYINVGTGSILNYNANYSITAWIKLYAFNVSSENEIVNYGAYRRFDVGGSVYGNRLHATFGGAASVTGITAIATGVWHHVAVTIMAGVQTRLYLNGADNTGSYSNAPDVVAPAGLANTIGKAGWDAGYKFNGAIDDVRMYSRTLTSDEVSQIYNSGNGTEAE